MNEQTSVILATKVKHPKALYGIGLAMAFERFAYYGCKPLLILFLSKQIIQGGLGITRADAAIIAANLGAFTYLAPIIGGIVADKWLGSRYCVMIGSVLMSAGWALGYFATSAAWINALIIVVSIGTGFYKGNINTLTGDLYEKDDPRKDMAYSITYSFVNGGVLVGSLVMGIFYTSTFATRNVAGQVLTYGFKECYLLGAIVTLISGLVFAYTCKELGDLGKKPNKFALPSGDEAAIELANRPLTKQEKNKVVVIFILALFSIFFWTFYLQSDASLLLYVDKYTNYNIGGFLVPTTWSTTMLNGLLCVILAPIMVIIWRKLANTRSGGDFTMTQKIALGNIFLGLGFLIMVGAEAVRGGNTGANSSIFWVLGFTLFQTIGEMCFSPLGTSVVSRTAPPKYLALLMGVWFFATFIANKASGYVETAISSLGTMEVFVIISAILFIGAIVLFACNKKISALTE
ncbi:peptide MFS transporter [Clostridium sp. CF012]|uniref:peptide MFS transporter n=1 Tax=Clostridium sp. CF012 TaxID=2843319 RepID=UPI001C0C6FDF|nr:peptide MFS transporter [Clostridium sp. CF012]MBU3145209.1 peptide MFS transporter [Clostridium sp. CF012]